MTIGDQTVRATAGESGAPPASCRAFLAGMGVAAAGTAGAALLGGPLAGTAQAAQADCPPDKKFAPVPKSALGPRSRGAGKNGVI
jgi:hypothetical protein